MGVRGDDDATDVTMDAMSHGGILLDCKQDQADNGGMNHRSFGMMSMR
jgi:hypothetical protein